MKNSIVILAIGVLTLVVSSCKKKETKPGETTTNPSTQTNNNTNNLTKLGETYIQGAAAKASVYAEKEAETGYNIFYVSFSDSTDGSPLSNGKLEVTPMMDMGTMKHSSPVENTKDTSATNGYFKCGVIFSMQGTASQWWLELKFTNHKNGKSGSGNLGVNVKASSPNFFKSTVVAADNNSSVFISYINPIKPQVGINEFEIVLNKKIDMMQYEPIENYTVEIEPEMPSMGHGSPNNVNPTHTVNGHYKGKVNFTMSGLWRINLKLYKDGTLVSEGQYFEITI